MAPPANKRVNQAVSRIIPPTLLGVVIYVSYVITKQLCINYLFYPLPRYGRARYIGAGVVIIIIYYLLLIFMLATYLRLFYNVAWAPGYLPRGGPFAKDQEGSSLSNPYHHWKRKGKRVKGTEKRDGVDLDLEGGVEYGASGKAFPLDVEGLESFYTKDVFVCKADGRPAYCSSCCQFKTDRAHHCREVDRCVRKMDHFCPWVGGVVSETSLKFFIQFVLYATCFCIFVLIVTAIFTAELKRNMGSANPHWAVCIGLSGFFGIFAFGMTIGTIQLAAYNLTTIENLSRRTAVWTLAVRVPDYLVNSLNTESGWAPAFSTVSYPLQLTPPAIDSQERSDLEGKRHVFAILQTQPGENPFDLGSWMKNLQQVLGYSLLDWFLPFKQSPCANHSDSESAFALGPVVTRLKREAGLG